MDYLYTNFTIFLHSFLIKVLVQKHQIEIFSAQAHAYCPNLQFIPLHFINLTSISTIIKLTFAGVNIVPFLFDQADR